MAFLLNLIFLLPNLIYVSRNCLLNYWQYDLKNNTAFIFKLSFVTTFIPF